MTRVMPTGSFVAIVASNPHSLVFPVRRAWATLATPNPAAAFNRTDSRPWLPYRPMFIGKYSARRCEAKPAI
jgi:hypothetical protein